MRAPLSLTLAVVLGLLAPVAHAAGKAESPAVAAARKLLAAQLVAITEYGKYSEASFARDAAILVDSEQYHGWWGPDEMPAVFDTSSGGAGPVDVQKSRFVAAADGKSAWIFAQLRVSRTLLGLFAGGALSLAGTLFQAMLRDALATPYTATKDPKRGPFS